MMDFQDLIHAIHAAEVEGDIDGCAACQLQMLEMTKAHPELLRTVDTTYLRIDYLMRILAAAVLAFGRGEWKMAKYYMLHFPPQFLKRQGCFPEHRAMLGRIAYEEGAFGEASQFLTEHLAEYPDDEMAWFWLGNAWFQQGRFQKAVAAYTRALHRKKSLREASENRVAAFQKMCAQAGKLALLKTQSSAVEINAEDWEVVRHLPIFINCRDRVGCLSQLVDWLLQAGYENLILLDNASSYAPLLQYYEDIRSERVRIVMLGENLGHTALWDSEVLEMLDIETPYVYTDPDVLPAEACPKRFLMDYLRVFSRYPGIQKVGAALRYDDITYEASERTRSEASCYYHAPLGDDVYFANVDTTVALYRNTRFYYRGPAVHMAGKYMFRHLPWYYDSENLPKDEVYYMKHANASSSTGTLLKTLHRI